jgi:preprotein translocase subunit SecD
MKNISKKTLFIAGGAILLLALIGFYYGLPAYTKYRMQKMPHLRVVLEMNIPRFLENMTKKRDEVYNSTMEEVSQELRMNSSRNVFDVLRQKFSEKQILLNRYYGRIHDSDDFIISDLKAMTAEALDRSREIISDRLDQYGVFEPSIRKQNSRRLVVLLPLKSPDKAAEEEIEQLLKMHAILEFRLVKDPDFTISVMQKIDNALAGSVGEDVSNADMTLATDTLQKEMTAEEFAREHPFFSIARINPQGQTADAYILDVEREKLEQMLNHPEVINSIPDNVEFVFSVKTFTPENEYKFYTLYLVNKEPELTGSVITNAEANIDPITSTPVVIIEMNSQGTIEWARITGANVGKRIAIMLDGVVFTAPSVRGKIPGGRSQIEGMESIDEAKLLEIVLKAGALPAPFEIISKEIIEAGK